MSDQTLAYAWAAVTRQHGAGRRGRPGAPSVAEMEAAARGRLDYNESRSGYAAPATELARYVLTLARLLPPELHEDGRRG